jgi:chromate transporter
MVTLESQPRARAAVPSGRLPDLVSYFLRLGAVGFGGPIATVGYMQRDLVERLGWVGERDFLDGIALGQAMPGPLAAQVVMWVGFLRARAIGALITAVAFILPSFTLVLAIAVIYARYDGLAIVRALFYGIAPGVVAIIALAAVKLARTTNKRDGAMWAIAAVVFAVTVIARSEIALLFLAAGLLMVALEAPPALLRRSNAFLLPGGAVAAAGGVSLSTHWALFFFFLKAGALIFGSGLAIVPFLHAGVVEDHAWLSETEFLDAVAMGLITPGPVVITATFIGYLVGGVLGALVATVAIFLPIYLGVVLPGPWFVRHRDNPQIKAFVRGATAAAAGAIGGVTVIIAQQAVVDLATGAISVVAMVLLVRLRVAEPGIVVLAAAAGLALYS